MKKTILTILLSLIIPFSVGAVNITVPQSTGFGDILRGNANGTYTPVATSTLGLGGSGGGTVTSVAMSVPTGLSISGSPITTSGTLALSLASGYSIPVTSTLWATTSSDYWLTQRSTSNLSEGSNLYYTNARVQTFLDTLSKGYFYSTTSANYWLTQQVIPSYSTTSQNYYNSQFRDWSIQNGSLSPTTTIGVVIGNATTTNATTTNLAFTGLTSGGLAVNSVGGVYKHATTTYSTGLTYSNGNVTCDTASASVFGCLSAASFSKFNSATTTFSTGLTYTLGTNAVTVNTSQNISTLSNLTSNGFVKTSGGTGALSIDTNTYLTGNQTVTLSGDISGSGATSITTTIGSDKITESMLKSVNTPTDEYCLTYESTVGDFQWQSCSSGGAAVPLTVETPTGTINGSNTNFTVSAEPSIVTVNGQAMSLTDDYTYSTPTITFVNAPLTGSVIRSYYGGGVEALAGNEGDVLYYRSGQWQGLASSTVDKVLKIDSNGYPSWGTDASGGGSSFGQGWEIVNGFLTPTTTIGVLMGNSTSTNATTTNLYVSGQTRLASLSGILKGTTGVVSTASNGTDYTLISGLTCSGTDKVSAIDASGNITCSTDQTWATTSASYFASQGLAFSTTSSNYWLTQQTIPSFSTTSATYWDSTLARWATTSSDYWESTKSRWSTTSTDYWLAQQSLSSFSTSSANFYNSQFRDFSINSFGALAPTTTRGIFVSASSTIGSGTQTGGLTINGGATTTGNAYFVGNVGIGTTSPIKLLEIDGNVSGGIARITRGTINNPASYPDSYGTYDVGVRGSGTIPSSWGVAQTFTVNGNIVSDISSYTDGDPTWGKLEFRTYDSGTAYSALTIDSLQNIGIGTTSPYAKLSVVGEVVARNFTATSTTATSTFAGTVTVGTATTAHATSTLQLGNTDTGIETPGCINMVYKTGASTYATSSIYFNTSGVLTTETNACK